MADEFTGGEGAPSPGAGGEQAAEYATGATDQDTGAEQEPEFDPIPYDRFKEVNDEKNQLRNEVARLSQQQQQYVAMLQQSMNQKNQPATAAAEDPEAVLARSQFGNDAEGEAAFEAVRKLVQYEMKSGMKDVEGRLVQSTRQEVQGMLGNATGSLQTSQSLNDMQSQGLIDEATKTELAQEMGNILKSNPQWQGQQPLLLKSLYGEKMMNGQIRQGVPRAPGGNAQGGNRMPMQPGSGVAPQRNGARAAAAQQQSEDAELNEIKNMFPRTFGSMTPDAMRQSVGVLPRSTRTVQHDGQDVDEDVLHASYTFRK